MAKRTWKIVDILRNGDGGDMLHDQRQLSRTCTVIFRWYDTSPTLKSRLRWPIHNLPLFMLARSQLTLRRRFRGWHRRFRGKRRRLRGWQLPEIALTAHCRSQTHRRRWPSNPNGRLKFRNLFVYVSKIAANAPAAAPRPTEIVQTARCRRRKHRRQRPGDVQDRSKFRNYENLCLRDQAKPLKKHLFAVSSPLLQRHCELFFPTRNGFCSHLRKIISRRPWPPPKNRDIHIEEFFRFYL